MIEVTIETTDGKHRFPARFEALPPIGAYLELYDHRHAGTTIRGSVQGHEIKMGLRTELANNISESFVTFFKTQEHVIRLTSFA